MATLLEFLHDPGRIKARAELLEFALLRAGVEWRTWICS